MRKLFAAILLCGDATSPLAEILFTCTDAGGCQAPLPSATLVSASPPFSLYRFFWLTLVTGAAGLSGVDSMWATGGAWQAFNVENTARGFFRMQGDGFSLEAQLVYDFAGLGNISDSGTWNLRAPAPPVAGVPEPGTLALLGLGLGGLGLVTLRRRRA